MANEKLSSQVTALMQQLEKMNKGFSDATEKLKKFDENIEANNRKYTQKSNEIRSALGKTDDDETIAKLIERQTKLDTASPAYNVAQRGEKAKAELSSYQNYVNQAENLFSTRNVGTAMQQARLTPEVRAEGMIYAQNQGTPSMLNDLRKNNLALDKNRSEISEYAKKYTEAMQSGDASPEELAKIQSDMQGVATGASENITKNAVLERAIQQRRSAGMDEYSRHDNNLRFNDSLTDSIRASQQKQMGESLNPEEAFKNLENAAKKLQAALDKTTEAAKQNAEGAEASAEKLEAAIEEEIAARQEAENAQNQYRGSMRAGGGGSGGNYITMAGKSAMAVGTGMQGISVDNPIELAQAKQSMLEIENSRYADMLNAGSGDAGAMRRLGMMPGKDDQYSRLGDLAETMGMKGQAAQALLQGGGIVNRVGDAVARNGVDGLVGNVTGMFNKGGGAQADAVASGALGVAEGAVALDRFSDNLPAAATYRRAYEAFRGQDESQNVVFDRLQNAVTGRSRDMMMGTRGLGGARRDDIYSQMMDPAMMQRLAGVGIDQQQSAAMLQQGGSLLGSELDPSQIGRLLETGGNAVQSGLATSTSDFMNNLGSLESVSGKTGGSMDRMEQVMSSAVAKGMDSSKNIRDMVSGIVSLSSGQASRGVDVSEAMTTMLADSAGTLKEGGMSANMAMKAAQNQLGSLNNMATGSELSISNLGEAAAINDRFGQMSLDDASALQNIDQATLKQLVSLSNKGDKKGFKDLATNQGIGMQIKTGQDAQDLLGISQDANLENILGQSNPEMTKSIMSAVSGGEDLTDRQRNFLGQKLRASNQGNVDTFLAADQAIRNGTAVQGDVTGTGGAANQAETTIGESAATMQAKEFQAGTQLLADAKSTVSDLNTAIKNMANSFNPKEVSNNMKDIAETLGRSEGGLNNAVQGLETAVDKLSTILGKMSMDRSTKARGAFSGVYGEAPGGKTPDGKKEIGK